MGSCTAPPGGLNGWMKLSHLLFWAAAIPLHAAMEVKEGSGGIDVLEDGKPLTRYHFSRVPYLYPLPSDSGANLARHWPIEDDVPEEDRDHPHHRSLWLSHGSVNGFDFWAWTGRGDPQIKHVATLDPVAGGKEAGFTAKLDWIAGGKVHLHEVRRHTFRRIDDRTWSIEVISELSPAEDEALFGDTKEGTFALRVDRSLRFKGPRAEGHILDSEGRSDDECWGKRSDWVAFHGPDEKDEPAVIAIFDHPDSFRHPTWWHARDYGLLAANPFGIHDFEAKEDSTLGNHTLKKGSTLKLRYLVVIHHGTMETARLKDRWIEYSK